MNQNKEGVLELRTSKIFYVSDEIHCDNYRGMSVHSLEDFKQT